MLLNISPLAGFIFLASLTEDSESKPEPLDIDSSEISPKSFTDAGRNSAFILGAIAFGSIKPHPFHSFH